ncbi:hypothetical protein BCR41DRAFT_367297 [Lobosporangium transversale]|uniref:Nucleotide-diphospho-sugar transferase n=1 Tax=Lobosporangium transversale TaxID=64571 RepID=A0A1Y2H0Y3_9FUNG|nr:hypothetical protein BCR41DRAFT_367297 [Lobosporangium transversale]ORZ27704.1 hypothetical protein BCR41DRAFT_367297 [Lobosporangium transversale]|eukprot:XP_021885407.1 hypothetical protein BCR41DRAFT_367297 [Lobosporangium transversale]
MDFHIFWRGPITDKLSLSSHAFLFTQPLNRAHLHLWIDSADLPGGVPEDYIKNPYSAPLVTEPLNQYITIHSWNQTAELAYSYPNQQSEQEIGKDGPAKPVALSDEARFLILNRNGGIYLDADVLLLKDMSPFYDAGLEFAYEWSHTGMYNTAILRLLPGSSVARRILDGAKRRKAEILRLKQLERELQRQRMEEQQLEAEMEEMEEEERREKELENIRDEEKEASVAKKSTLDFVHQVRTHVKNKALKPLPKSSSHRRLRRRQLRVLHGMRPEEIYHPARLREYLRPQDKAIEGNGLIMVPPAVFDPLWLRVDHAEPTKSTDPEKMLEDLPGFTDVFHEAPNTVCPRQEGEEVEFSAGPEVFFTGAYAYHWHNSWQASIEPKSWMGFMLKAYKDSVERRRPNLYGEWFPKNL